LHESNLPGKVSPNSLTRRVTIVKRPAIMRDELDLFPLLVYKDSDPGESGVPIRSLRMA